MKNNLKIAVTGGIGSGKSTVLDILNKLGYATVSFDNVYNEMLQDENYVLKISEKFSILPLIKDGKITLDKNLLSQKIFSDSEALKRLNEFTHESIFKRAFEKQSTRVTFYEVPLLFEGNYQERFDAVWVIMREYDARMKSASERDLCDVEKIKRKARNQVDYEKLDLSLHTVIVNDGNIAELEKKVKRAISENDEI